MSWHTLIGTPGYAAGTTGTATIPAGSILILLTAHASAASATVSIFGGAAIPVPAAGTQYLTLQFNHTLFQANSVNSGQIIFTNCDHYFVHWVREGNT